MIGELPVRLRVPPTAISSTVPSGTSGPSVTYTDLLHWGQDGLALLTSAGQIAILRGPFVVPQLLSFQDGRKP